MVTSNKLLDKKVVKMSEHNNSVVVPQRTLLGEVNEHITCPLCRGYYIDATTIVECLHSFCRSCIIKHLKVKSYCPVCEMMINSAKPNIKLDKALQDIVYKLVPGLFQKEMERRQQFYASRPGPAASATPEQRGEDTERVIFSPEDVISFSLEYSDATDADSISSKSSDSNESQPPPGITRRYLQCPAVVNISHLKKFLSMKFDIDSTQFAIDILYKRVPLPDYYTLMDIAYIYNWKRNEPMRFFYQIIDYVAIRNRLFDINRKSLDFRDRKSSPACTEDTNESSPAVPIIDHASEASSGTDSPMPDDNNVKLVTENTSNDKLSNQDKKLDLGENNPLSSNKNDEDVEKSQFLNSFELTAKSNCLPLKSSPNKSSVNKEELTSSESTSNNHAAVSKLENMQLKRKNLTPTTPELKKLKIELEKAKISNYITNLPAAGLPSNANSKIESGGKQKEMGETSKNPIISQTQTTKNTNTPSTQVKEVKPQHMPATKPQVDTGLKRPAAPQQLNSSPKRKPNEIVQAILPSSVGQKSVPFSKPVSPYLDTLPLLTSPEPIQKPVVKKIPDLKPSAHMSQTSQHKPPPPPVNKLRMDLLANNSDPTIDRSKILPQVKCSLGVTNPGQTSGDSLKSLFDSCKLNIPSSLSITLTDQKLESRGCIENGSSDSKKNIVNKNLTTAASNSTLKAPSPPVHNYIEILKIPDPDTKKCLKIEGSQEMKINTQNKTESCGSQPKPNKTSETTAKGPIPNLKPISDTKLGKQTGNFSSPITFQQTFEQQLQSMQSDKKSKLPKTKAQVPKLVPANPKAMSNVNKSNNPLNKPPSSNNAPPSENKTSTALDLSTAHNIQSQLSSQQTFDKTLETMQSIANLAKKQSLPSKGLPINMTQNAVSTNLNRSLPAGVSPSRIPTTSGMGQMKTDKASLSNPQVQGGGNRQDVSKANQIKAVNNGSPTVSPPSYNMASHVSSNPTQPSPHSQTRSPSSSPKLVIAEEKQASASNSDQSINQSNQISSTQLSSGNTPKSESPKASAGPSKPNTKPINKQMQPGKIAGIWQPMPPNLKSSSLMNNPAEYFSRQYLPKPIDINNANNWFRQFELLKSMSNMAHQQQNDFSKEKQ